MSRSALPWIFAVGLLARMASIVALSPSSENLLASAHHEHASIAKNLAEGRGFRFNFFGDIDHPDLTSQQAPFLPGILAAAYTFFGIESSSALWLIVALQITAGAIACVALADAVSNSSVNVRLGVIAGLVAAIYPPFVVASLHIQALPWNLLWIALMLSGTARVSKLAPFGVVLLFIGGVGGIYTDPILAIVLTSLLAWLLTQTKLATVRTCATTAALIGVAIAPWIVRNYVVHGRFEFIKNSFPYVFWQGNTLLSAGTDKLLVDDLELSPLRGVGVSAAASNAESARRRSRSVNEIALTIDDLHQLAALPNEARRMDWFGRRIRAELTANPMHYPRMCLKRLEQWLWFDDTNPKSFVGAYRLSYITLLAGTVIGLIASTARRRSPFVWAAFALSFVHVLVITSARFRVCFELLMVPHFAIGIATAFDLMKMLLATRVQQIPQTSSSPTSA